VSQEVFCSVLTEVLVLCYEPQCHKKFSVLCWQKSLFSLMNRSATRSFLFCVDRSPCSVLGTIVSQVLFCSVLREVIVLCYEPHCHKGFSVLCWQKPLFCVTNHSVKRGFLLCVNGSPCSVLCSTMTPVLILQSALNLWPQIYFFGAENKWLSFDEEISW
jgi:hypothetical protein